jgi:uncharacterized protein YndB with AHSA1/START domain
MTLFRCALLTMPALLIWTSSAADIVASSDTHFVLRHEAASTQSRERVWERLVRPADWWHPDHTYSGDAGHLRLDPVAGGLWREDWPGGSVTHGEVKYVRDGEVLRLEAPFGPLQGLGAYVIWTITVTPSDTGVTVVFDEVAMAPPGSKMEEMAKAVDFVKGEAIRRLVSGE